MAQCGLRPRPIALVAFGDLSDHIGRRKVLAVAVGCAAVSTALFLAPPGTT